METEFTHIISTHAGILHKVCRLYSSRDEDREDLYQEIVLQLWRAFPAYRHESQVSTWLYRIALNTAISLYRRQSRRITSKLESSHEFAAAQTVALSETDERIDQFYSAINYLSPVEKALIFLYLDANSYEEISRIIGISPSNVGVKLNRIKRKLKQIIKTTNP